MSDACRCCGKAGCPSAADPATGPMVRHNAAAYAQLIEQRAAGREATPCTHPLPDLGRFEQDVCHACGEDVSEGAPDCAVCGMRLAVVAVRHLADVALHVTRTRPFGDGARCVECCLDDVTRLVVKP